MAEAFDLPVAPHDCVGPITMITSIHLALNAPNALIQETVRAFVRVTSGFTPIIDINLRQIARQAARRPDLTGRISRL
jgi:L-alanine-DL-glutamate epimerase-like enolase superfamily enzyme